MSTWNLSSKFDLKFILLNGLNLFKKREQLNLYVLSSSYPLQHSCLENTMGGGAWWAAEESDTIERLPFHFSLSCIGEGNGNPLQCSCLENPMDGEAWWAAVYGVSQSRTQLKQLSSSSSNSAYTIWCLTDLLFV